MKTTSLNVLNLCVRCYSHCRYCLLSWDGKCLGIDYDRSVAYARQFHDWLKKTHPEIRFVYYFGYSMDHPNLAEAIRFMQETHSPGGEFLQFDGMRMRTDDELHELLTGIKNAGIRLIDFTFYGTKDYHDRFAGRKGDFDLMMRSLNIAQEIGLDVEAGVPVTKENLCQIDSLLALLPEDRMKIFLFTPHSGGRGIHLLDAKMTADDYESLSDHAKSFFNRTRNQTPSEWLRTPLPVVQNRVLTLSLLPSNIEELEHQSFEETLRTLEHADEAYYGSMPDFATLLKHYAAPDDKRLYSQKDLYMLYRKRYAAENNLALPDFTDERFSGSLRL